MVPSEMLRCWKDRWDERQLVLAVGGLVLAFVLAAAALVQEYSSPVMLALLR